MWNLDDEGGLFLQVLVFTLKTYFQQWIWKCSTLSHRKSLLQMRTHKHYYNKQNIIILWDLQPLPVERTLVIHHSRAPMIPTDKTKGFRKKQSNIFLWTRILYDIKMCHFFLFNTANTFRPIRDQHPISLNNINTVKPWYRGIHSWEVKNAVSVCG